MAVSAMQISLDGICFFLMVAILGITAHSVFCIADLYADFSNPMETCKRLNQVVMPERGAT